MAAKAQQQNNIMTKGLEISLLIFRIALGFNMFYMAYILFTGGWDAFNNASALIPDVVQGPLGDIMISMYGNPVPIYLLATGAGFIAISFIAGFLVRLGAYSGILIAISFYLSALPPANGWVNVQIIYMISFIIIAASNAGYKMGLDKYLKQLEEKYPQIKYISG